MPTLTVELTPELDQFIATEVAAGHYEDAGAVVLAALASFERAEHDDEARLIALRAAIDEGDASGLVEGDIDEVFTRLRDRLGWEEQQ